MKKILNKISIYFLIWAFSSSCSTEYDNYPTPSETFFGTVTDQTTGESIQTEVGSGGIRIRLDELSWSDNPQPYYFYFMQDGSFKNTKIFQGEYRISVEGPFVPLIQKDKNGNIIKDNSKVVKINGVTEVNFKVEPFLRVEWIGEPVVNNDNSITAEVKITRGTDHPNYQLNVTDVYLYVNSNPYVGNNNFDGRYSTLVSFSPNKSVIGERLTIKTRGGALPGKRSYYIRIGARTGFGLMQYNYNKPIQVKIP